MESCASSEFGFGEAEQAGAWAGADEVHFAPPRIRGDRERISVHVRGREIGTISRRHYLAGGACRNRSSWTDWDIDHRARVRLGIPPSRRFPVRIDNLKELKDVVRAAVAPAMRFRWTGCREYEEHLGHHFGRPARAVKTVELRRPWDGPKGRLVCARMSALELEERRRLPRGGDWHPSRRWGDWQADCHLEAWLRGETGIGKPVVPQRNLAEAKSRVRTLMESRGWEFRE